ncbi:unnamed protein product [Lupinus luteus]|uniref:Uncharacterized protein n=1 Tax=Lupinus luteus TaxID=3873 RepID=A0AAV1YFP0_LUPLU
MAGWTTAHYSTQLTVDGTKAGANVFEGAVGYFGHKTIELAAKWWVLLKDWLLLLVRLLRSILQGRNRSKAVIGGLKRISTPEVRQKGRNQESSGFNLLKPNLIFLKCAHESTKKVNPDTTFT